MIPLSQVRNAIERIGENGTAEVSASWLRQVERELIAARSAGTQDQVQRKGARSA